jgi:hypothetical protein
MTNIDTIHAVTDNLQSGLQNEGIRFSRKTYDDEKNIPASLIPFGEVIYQGEAFEYTHGQRPGYVEARFVFKVVLKERDPVDMMREEQGWVHRIRGAITVDALNTGALLSSKLVSRVTFTGVEVMNRDYISVLVYRVSVRYRES